MFLYLQEMLGLLLAPPLLHLQQLPLHPLASASYALVAPGRGSTSVGLRVLMAHSSRCQEAKVDICWRKNLSKWIVKQAMFKMFAMAMQRYPTIWQTCCVSVLRKRAAQVFVKSNITHGYTFLSPESMRLEMAEKKQKTHTHQQNILQLMTPKHILAVVKNWN